MFSGPDMDLAPWYQEVCTIWQEQTDLPLRYPSRHEIGGCASLADSTSDVYRNLESFQDLDDPNDSCASDWPHRPGDPFAPRCVPHALLVVGEAGFCSGVLVSPDVVLTARHCLPAERVVSTVSARHATEFATDGTTLLHLQFGAREVVQTALPAERRTDAALLLLEAPLGLEVVPWRTSRDTEPLWSEQLMVEGFGRFDDRTDNAGTLLATWEALGDWDCRGATARWAGCIPGRELLTVGIPDRGSANQGDSGGPLYEFKDGFFRLVGITSRGLPGAPSTDGGIYTRVDYLSDWMFRTIYRWSRY